VINNSILIPKTAHKKMAEGKDGVLTRQGDIITVTPGPGRGNVQFNTTVSYEDDSAIIKVVVCSGEQRPGAEQQQHRLPQGAGGGHHGGVGETAAVVAVGQGPLGGAEVGGMPPLRNAHQRHASTTSSSSSIETIDYMGGGVGTTGGQGQVKKVAQKGRKRTAKQQGSNSVIAKVGSDKKKTQRRKEELGGGEQTWEDLVRPKKALKVYGKTMLVDPSRIQGGSFVVAKIKKAGDEVGPTRAMEDFNVLGNGNGHLLYSEWLQKF
jgi:hypothetical protein